MKRARKKRRSGALGVFMPRLSYANVVATLALFIALGGSSYAALKLPRNSVGSAQIRSGAVHSSDVADGSLSSTVPSVAVHAQPTGFCAKPSS